MERRGRWDDASWRVKGRCLRPPEPFLSHRVELPDDPRILRVWEIAECGSAIHLYEQGKVGTVVETVELERLTWDHVNERWRARREQNTLL